MPNASPKLFGKIPVSEPSLEDRHGVEGWCYTAATPSARTPARTRIQTVVVWYEKDTVIGFEVEEFSQEGPSPNLMGGNTKNSE